MVPTLYRILDAKPLPLDGKISDDEVTWLQNQLPQGGLAITARRTAF
jgi:hypothetical protein